MNRRGFLGAILAAGVAPAIVRVESLMVVRNRIVTYRAYSGVMTATEVVFRREEYLKQWAKMWSNSLPLERKWFTPDA